MKKETIARTFIYSFLSLWILLSLWPDASPKEGNPPLIYSSECSDRLFSIFIKAIQKADKEIYFMTYSLADKRVIEALNQATKRGVEITLIHDPKTETENFSLLDPTIKKKPFEGHALMHRKILIIDQTLLYIGSANGTAASLRLHHNLVLGMHAAALCHQIIEQHERSSFEIGGQYVEFYTFPEERMIGLPRLLSLIDKAEHSLEIAMFTWTYAPLTEAVIRAQERGVNVTVFLDQQAAFGTSRKTLHTLLAASIPVRLGPNQKLLHHKFVYVDKEILASGSSNWTKAAFFRNQDCLIILHSLTKKQRKKIDSMIKIMRCSTTKADNDAFY